MLVHRLDGLKVEERYLRSENGQDDIEFVAAGDTLTVDQLQKLELNEFELLTYEDVEVESEIWDIVDEVAAKTREIRRLHDEKVERLSKGDDLPPGIIKKVIVYVAIKRKLQVGTRWLVDMVTKVLFLE